MRKRNTWIALALTATLALSVVLGGCANSSDAEDVKTEAVEDTENGEENKDAEKSNEKKDGTEKDATDKADVTKEDTAVIKPVRAEDTDADKTGADSKKPASEKDSADSKTSGDTSTNKTPSSNNSSSTSNNSGNSNTGSSNNNSKPAHTHNWQTTSYKEEGHWETKTVQEAYEEEVYAWQTFCGVCGTNLTYMNDYDLTNHVCECGGNYYTDYRPTGEVIHHDAVTEDVWVVDRGAYTETWCSCGATK